MEHIPAPPQTSDPITWVAIACVMLMIFIILTGGGWVARIGLPRLLASIDKIPADIQATSAEASKERREQLMAFRDEMRLEREANARALREDRGQRSLEVQQMRSEINRVHERIDSLATSLSTCDACQIETARRLEERAASSAEG